ncbi:hypothetical protein [Pontibacter russatus]|uniref:hypothetical protein n=1 Tax=Pontibacter russatus TaxID=2694929 RepID=UPI00137A7A84|nr:hypothetical protein [Pontibacter russatus]
MKILLTIFLSLGICQFGLGQTYSREEIISEAKKHLKEAVGEQASQYFKYGGSDTYKFRTKTGKEKWKKLPKASKTRGNFIETQIKFEIDHPDYKYKWVNKYVFVKLDSSLNPKEKIYTGHVPSFILKNEPSNWLSEEKIDSIINKLSLKAAVKPIIKRLEFDVKAHEHYWRVFNTLAEERCFADVEILSINPITGDVIEHREERQYVMHCY